MVADGDEEAFRELYRRHAAALFGLARRLSGYDEPRAEDILQQTWLRALTRLSAFRWESQLRTWLSGIVVNCAHENRRAEEGPSSTAPVHLGDLAGEQGKRADGANRLLGGVRLERALARLPDGYRHAIILHDVEGYTHREIGLLLGVSEGTSKSQLSRARGAMRALLEPPSEAGDVINSDSTTCGDL